MAQIYKKSMSQSAVVP